MVGYGPEDSHFVIELTYNYGLGSYKLGNDFLVKYEPPRGKTNNVVSEQVRHKPACTSTEAG